MDKERVCLAHGCYICGNILSNASSTRNHIARIHGMHIPPREPSVRRPQDKDYAFVSQGEEYDSDHYACPSCWYHCPQTNLDSLNKHTLLEHDPQSIKDLEDKQEYGDDEEEEEDMPTVRNGRRQSFSSNLPASRQASRSLSRSSSRQSLRQPGRPRSNSNASRPTSRPASRAEAENEEDDDSKLISKKVEELVDLLKVMFTR